MDKRTFLKSLLLGSAGIFALGLSSSLKAARSSKKWDGIFRMPELPYSYDSLEPFANASTMRIHYEHHFAGYTQKLNEAVSSAGLTGITAHQLLKESSKYPSEIRNLTGSYLNHKLFWRVLTPGNGKKPSRALTSAVNRSFGSFENMRKSFAEKSASLQGQGWIWLVADKDCNLKITATSNHDNPIMDVVSEKGFPLLCLDMWEESGCDNGKTRTDYVSAFWNIINWDVVSNRLRFSGKQ